MSEAQNPLSPAWAKLKAKLAADPERRASYLEMKRRIRKAYEQRRWQRMQANEAELARYRAQKRDNLRRFRSTHAGKLRGLKTGAKVRGLAFELSDERAIELISSPCHYCGHPGREYGLNGIDRKDNEKAYIEGNVLPCCGVCNQAKSGRSYETTVAWMKDVAKHWHKKSVDSSTS